METQQHHIDYLQQRIRYLEEKEQEAQQKLFLLEEMLSSQRTMLDDAVAYATQLETKLLQPYSTQTKAS